MASIHNYDPRFGSSWPLRRALIPVRVSPLRTGRALNRPGSIVASWLDALSTPSRLPVVQSTSRVVRSISSRMSKPCGG